MMLEPKKIKGKKDTLKNEKPYILTGPKGYLSVEYYFPSPSGDNAYADATSGNGAFNFRLKYNIYKGIFLGGALGTSYLQTDDTSLIGEFRRTRITNSYMFLGYEQVVSKKITIGASVSPFWKSKV